MGYGIVANSGTLIIQKSASRTRVRENCYHHLPWAFRRATELRLNTPSFCFRLVSLRTLDGHQKHEHWSFFRQARSSERVKQPPEMVGPSLISNTELFFLLRARDIRQTTRSLPIFCSLPPRANGRPN